MRRLAANCIAAALLPGLLAVLSYWWLSLHYYEQHHQRIVAEQARSLAAVASFDQVAASDVRNLLPQLEAVARVVFSSEGDVQVLDASGEFPLSLDVVSPEMVAAVERPQSWQVADHIWLAVRGQSAGDNTANHDGVIVVAVRPGIAPLYQPWGAMAAVLAAAMLMACYLVRRIYQPICAIVRAAEAVRVGKTQRFQPEFHSSETRALASSVEALVVQRLGPQLDEEAVSAHGAEAHQVTKDGDSSGSQSI